MPSVDVAGGGGTSQSGTAYAGNPATGNNGGGNRSPGFSGYRPFGSK